MYKGQVQVFSTWKLSFLNLFINTPHCYIHEIFFFFKSCDHHHTKVAGLSLLLDCFPPGGAAAPGGPAPDVSLTETEAWALLFLVRTDADDDEDPCWFLYHCNISLEKESAKEEVDPLSKEFFFGGGNGGGGGGADPAENTRKY